MKALKFHPLADIFPLMQGTEFDALVADIKANGLRENIVLFEGKILDGRNRYRACLAASVEPRISNFEHMGLGVDPVAFVISKNIHRRHLSESQRAIVATRLATLRIGHNQHAQGCAPYEEQAGELLGGSRRSVKTARQVVDHGAPELVAAVERGEISISAAAKEIRASATVDDEANQPLSNEYIALKTLPLRGEPRDVLYRPPNSAPTF